MARKRKSLSKKLRFRVFRRDNFTCQYCGSKSPSVVLEIDHVEPVSKGGSNDFDNLKTSCFDCNRGKSDMDLYDDDDGDIDGYIQCFSKFVASCLGVDHVGFADLCGSLKSDFGFDPTDDRVEAAFKKAADHDIPFSVLKNSMRTGATFEEFSSALQDEISGLYHPMGA